MADMQVAMRLTLADAASGPLAEFVAKLEKLPAMAAEITQRFNVLSKSIGSIGLSSQKSVDGLSGLTTAIGSLSERMVSLEARLKAGAASFVELTGAATESATAVELSAAKLDAASASVVALKGHVGGLSDSLRGMAELWAGFKIEKGLKASVNAAADMQTQMASMRAAGFSSGAANYARDWSERNTPGYASANEVMQGRRAFILATGQNNEQLINQALPQVLKNAFAVQQVSGGDLKGIIQNMLGIAESRGLSMSAAGIVKASNLATQITEASQGRMDLQKQEMVLRQSKYGLSALANNDGIANLMAFAEQFIAAGHSGGSGGGGGRGVSQAGTAASMVLKTMLGGKMNKVTYQLLQQMGMIESGGAVGSSSTTSMNAITKIKGTAQGSSDPIGWMMQTLAPAMTAYVNKHPGMYFPGGKADTGEGLQKALDRLAIQLFGPTGGVNVGNLAYVAANPGTASRINAQRARIHASASGDQAANLFSQTQAGQVRAFHAALSSLETSLGQTFLPMVTKIIEALNSFLRWINRLALQFPNLTRSIAGAAAAFSAFLVINGTIKLFGLMTGSVSSLVGWFFKIGPAAKVAAAETVAATETMAAATTTSAATMATAATAMTARFASLFALARKYSLIATFVATASGDSMPSTYGSGTVSATAALAMAKKESATSYGGKMTAAQLRTAAADFMVPAGGGDRTKRNSPAYLHAFAAIDAALNPKSAGTASASSAAASGSGLRAPTSVPNAEDAQLASLLHDSSGVLMPGGVPGSSSGHAARSHGHHSLSAAAKAASQAVRELADQFRQAQRAVAAGMAKVNPVQAIRAKYGHYADILGMGGDSAGAANALTIGDKLANQAGYKQSNGDLQKLKAQLQAEEQLIAARKQSGSITKQQSEQQDIAAQKGIAAAMEQAAQAALKYANALKDPTLIAAMQAQIEKIKAMGTQLNDTQKGVQDTFQQGVQGLLSNIMRGNMSWKNMLAQFNNSILSGMNNVISQKVSQNITGSASNSSIGQFILGLFGSNGASGGTSGTPASAGASSGDSGFSGIASEIANSSWGKSAGSWLAGLFGPGTIGSYATGIDNVPHDMVAQIHAGERVVDTSTNKLLTNALSGGGLGGHQINLSIHAMDSQSVLGSLDSVKRELAMMLGGASSNLNLAA